MSIIYCATGSSPEAREEMLAGRIALVATPNGGSPPRAGVTWCADTGLYHTPAAKNPRPYIGDEGYIGWLQDRDQFADDCLFATAPDVPYDAAATLRRSWPMLGWIQYAGYRAALVAQNGLTPRSCPWGDFDVLFLGGDDAFKLGPDGRALADEAHRQGVPVHMGRVNSLKRLRYADHIGCSSADGTFLRFGADIRLPELLSWVGVLDGQGTLWSRAEELFGQQPLSPEPEPA
jgi:hypothetical protein